MAKKRTSWFTGGVKPRRAGVYETEWNVWFLTDSKPRVASGYAYWSRRKGWRNVGSNPNEAMRRAHYPHPVAGPRWRGLLLSTGGTRDER